VTRPLPPAAAAAVALAAAVLAGASRGEAVVLGLLLVVLELRPTTVVAVAGALVASSWRWGSTSLEAWAGAQAVLGPAGGVGPAPAAASAWLGAAALILALGRRPDPIRALPAGIAAATVLAGPGRGGDVPIRIIVAVGAATLAYGLGRLRARRPRARRAGFDRAVDLLAAVAGIAAVVAVVPDAPGWPPSAEQADLWEGLVLAAGGALVAALAAGLAPRAPWSGGEVASNVDRPGPPPAHLRRS
jgi:hypothetical protein